MQNYKFFLRFVFYELFKPVKTLDYIQKWVELIDILHKARRENDKRTVAVFYSIHLVLLLNLAYILYFSQIVAEDKRVWLKFDVYFILGMNNKTYVIFAILFVMTPFIYHKFFININPYVHNYIHSILKEENKKLFHYNCIYKNQRAVTYLKKIMCFTLNIFQLFVYGLGELSSQTMFSLAIFFSSHSSDWVKGATHCKLHQPRILRVE